MPSNIDNLWTATEDDIIMREHHLGATTMQIAGLVGRTRNAVCGRIWRLRNRGLIVEKPLPPPPPKKRVRKPPRYRNAAGPRPPAPIVVPPLPPNAIGRNLLELGSTDCRFIIDSDDRRAPTHLYCGADASAFADGGENCYCAYHQTRLRAR